MTADGAHEGERPPIHLMSAFLRAGHQIVLELTERLRAEGFIDVRPAHSNVFENLDPYGPGTPLTELARRAQMSHPSMIELVDSLERLGYVERVRNPRDGRSRLVRITGRGLAAREAAHRVMEEIEARWSVAMGIPAAVMRDAIVTGLAAAEASAQESDQAGQVA